MRYLDIYISDLHTGHRSAIMYPVANEHKPNKPQKWLFKMYQQFLDECEAIAEEYKVDKIHSSIVGEIADIDAKGRSRKEHWSFDEDELLDNVALLHDPLYKLCDAGIHFIEGTAAHAGQHAFMDNLAARDCDVAIKPEEGHAWGVAEYLLGDVLVMARHRGKNRWKWASEKALVDFREEIFLKYSRSGDRVPDIVVGGHFHYPSHTRIDRAPHVIQLASWKLPYKDEFIQRIDAYSETPVVGGHVVVVEEDRILESKPLLYKVKRPKPKKV